MTRLHLDQAQIDRARDSARRIARSVFEQMKPFTTTTVERATLRLLGIDGVDENMVPLPNRLVSHLQEQDLLQHGAAPIVVGAMIERGCTAQQVAEAVADGKLTMRRHKGEEAIRAATEAEARKMCEHIARQRARRDSEIKSVGESRRPWLYLIVATGNIHEDVIQARAAAEQGADVIAVIRSTGQSLLDYVPHGATTEGFGGTYATQENFRLMRAALDEAGARVGRYIRLTNYCSGLCMPEIAAMGAMERLDMMLNDSMYGIIFRDINMQRTFIDQFFSRMVNAYAGIIINTGEDNYLTTADACEAAHTVLASQLINEQFAYLSGLKPEQMGLGHAFEINPEMENGFLWEIAHAQLVRQVFPEASLKYMPPTKHMTGNIFRGHIQDALFNVAQHADAAGYSPAWHDDRGHPHAVHPGPFPRRAEREVRLQYHARSARGSRIQARRSDREARTERAQRDGTDSGRHRKDGFAASDQQRHVCRNLPQAGRRQRSRRGDCQVRRLLQPVSKPDA
jgi:beta-lysine 5,6-aminomutase alpha subunit